ncbi:MAG: hypothetical protein ACRD43_13440, partial [Pyrinomonadaceae bacterium]
DTETAYYVFDSIFGATFANRPDRLADKKEEVARFVRQHLGVEPGTDLRALFRQAIGVPQGTYTAIFLEGAAERKASFDKLLKVEEYRQAAEKLRDTARFIDNKIVDTKLQIARFETEIGRVDASEKEFAEVSGQVASLGLEIESIGKDLIEKRERVSTLDAKEKTIADLSLAADRLRSEKAQAEIVCGQKDVEVKAARQSAEKLEIVRNDADRHVQTLGRLAELERERHERDNLRTELAKVEAAIVNVTADQKGVQQALENASKAHREIEALRPKAAEQKVLEKEVEALRGRYAHSRSLEERLGSVNQDLERLREAYRQQQAKGKALTPAAASSITLADLEKQDAETIRCIAALKAGLERDQRFQTEIKNGLCPILSEKCLNLKEGQTLEAFITSQFSQVRTRIDRLEKEKTRIDASLKQEREAEKNVALLESINSRIAELTEEGKKLRSEKDGLEKRLEGAVDTEKRLAEAEAKLRTLDSPDAQIKFHQSEAARENDLRHEMTTVEKNLERLASDKRLLGERLDEFREIDQQWALSTRERDSTVEAHRTFLLHESNAKLAAERETAFRSAQEKLSDVSAQFSRAEREALAAASQYNAEIHHSTRASLLDAERKHAGTEAALTAANTRAEQLASDLKRFAEIRETMKGELHEKERLEKVGEMTAFIRETLKESAPRVARNYVFLVSAEANQMYGEITGHVEQTLKWNEDYGISLDQDGFERPFVSLSGGEQMAAALSVRLAILKQLSDIRIAFFDEPTTNMDAERRENLAQQLSQIKNFDQLFVISHDDTFEGYVDSVISIGK